MPKKTPRQRAKTKPSATPTAPPQSLGEAVLLEAIAAVTDNDMAAFSANQYQAPRTDKAKKMVVDALIRLASVGFACVNMHRHGKQPSV